MLEAPEPPEVPPNPNPDGRVWHRLTVKAWEHAWESPMSTQWLETDIDALGRLALVWDALHVGAGDSNIVVKMLAEIRLQEQRFGLSPLDRSRLQWEVNRGSEAERKLQQRETVLERPTGTLDPRAVLQAVK